VTEARFGAEHSVAELGEIAKRSFDQTHCIQERWFTVEQKGSEQTGAAGERVEGIELLTVEKGGRTLQV
jgi:hypothetical protein